MLQLATLLASTPLSGFGPLATCPSLFEARDKRRKATTPVCAHSDDAAGNYLTLDAPQLIGISGLANRIELSLGLTTGTRRGGNSIELHAS
jgi:hypothetical protein